MEQRADLLEILDNIYPGELDYQEWVNVGMALKQEGYTAEDWDRWILPVIILENVSENGTVFADLLIR